MSSLRSAPAPPAAAMAAPAAAAVAAPPAAAAVAGPGAGRFFDIILRVARVSPVKLDRLLAWYRNNFGALAAARLRAALPRGPAAAYAAYRAGIVAGAPAPAAAPAAAAPAAAPAAPVVGGAIPSLHSRFFGAAAPDPNLTSTLMPPPPPSHPPQPPSRSHSICSELSQQTTHHAASSSASSSVSSEVMQLRAQLAHTRAQRDLAYAEHDQVLERLAEESARAAEAEAAIIEAVDALESSHGAKHDREKGDVSLQHQLANIDADITRRGWRGEWPITCELDYKDNGVAVNASKSERRVIPERDKAIRDACQLSSEGHSVLIVWEREDRCEKDARLMANIMKRLSDAGVTVHFTLTGTGNENAVALQKHQLRAADAERTSHMVSSVISRRVAVAPPPNITHLTGNSNASGARPSDLEQQCVAELKRRRLDNPQVSARSVAIDICEREGLSLSTVQQWLLPPEVREDKRAKARVHDAERRAERKRKLEAGSASDHE